MIRKIVLSVSMFVLVFGAALSQAGSRDEGITCVAKGSTVKAVYDKANGTVIERNQVVGNSYKAGQCMGRCGGGCGNFLPDAWTKDCLDHDICIVDQDGKNDLANDANCGNEFTAAADDYTFGVLRGCRG